MIESKSKNIDGIEVSVTQWTARLCLHNKFKIAKILGPVFSKLQSNDGSILDSDISSLGNAITELATQLDGTKLDEFISLIFKQQRFNGKEYSDSDFDVIFNDKLSAVYKSIFFVLEVNYKDFFVKSGIGNLLNKDNPVSHNELNND